MKPYNPHTLEEFSNEIENIRWSKLFDIIPELSSGNRLKEAENNFFNCVYDLNIVINFDWMQWEEGKTIYENRDFNIDNCSVIDLCKFITVFVRNEKFCHGFLESAIKNGNVLKVIKRLKYLIDKG